MKRALAGIVVTVAVASIALAVSYRVALHATRAELAAAVSDLASLRKEEEALRALATSVPEHPPLPDLSGNERISELQALVDQQAAELAALRAATQAVASVAAAPGTQVIPDAVAAATNAPTERRSWMEELQASDPERYQEILDRREQARQEARYDIARKAAHFLQQPTKGMTEEEAAEYARMMDLLTASLTLTEKLDAGLEGEDRREIMRTLRDHMRELSPMLDTERTKEFFQVGKDLGYSDEDAAAFATYLEDVVELTSVSKIFRNAMRGMGGWGGPPPPEPR